jgi:hypothetical protein
VAEGAEEGEEEDVEDAVAGVEVGDPSAMK